MDHIPLKYFSQYCEKTNALYDNEYNIRLKNIFEKCVNEQNHRILPEFRSGHITLDNYITVINNPGHFSLIFTNGLPKWYFYHSLNDKLVMIRVSEINNKKIFIMIDKPLSLNFVWDEDRQTYLDEPKNFI